MQNHLLSKAVRMLKIYFNYISGQTRTRFTSQGMTCLIILQTPWYRSWGNYCQFSDNSDQVIRIFLQHNYWLSLGNFSLPYTGLGLFIANTKVGCSNNDCYLVILVSSALSVRASLYFGKPSQSGVLQDKLKSLLAWRRMRRSWRGIKIPTTVKCWPCCPSRCLCKWRANMGTCSRFSSSRIKNLIQKQP